MTEKEFEKLFREYFTFMRNMAFSVVRDDDTARDIVQQVFLNFWNKRNKLVIRGNTKSYMQRAVINASINYLKKQKKLHFPDEIETLVGSYENNSDEETQALIENGVNNAIEQLSPKVRLVFSLSRFSQMPNKEIAEYLGVSVKAVEKSIGKALKELRVSLKPLYESVLVKFALLMVGLFKQFLS